jgi:hypothetical protein
MTVVRHELQRRWFLVLASATALAGLPIAISAWPTDTPTVDAQVLGDLIHRSDGQPYEGYAESVGVMGLPELPRLSQVTSLLSGTTRMRAWYAAQDRWRVDAVDTGSERGTYRTPDGLYSWDYGANRLTQFNLVVTGVVVNGGVVDPGGPTRTDVLGEPPARLPRPADLMPPDVARRLLAMADGDRVESIPGRRVAGVAAGGIRVTSVDPHSAVGWIDIWADPRSGLPLQVEVTARNAERPILATRFLEVALRNPGADVLAPPPRRNGLSVTTGNANDSPRPGGPAVVRFNPITVYGTGLTQFVVLPLSRRVARQVYSGIAAWGLSMTFSSGRAALIASPLLSVMIVQPTATNRTYLIAGMVTGEYMQQVGTELVGGGK